MKGLGSYAINRLSRGYLEFGESQYYWDGRFRQDKRFKVFCLGVLKNRSLVDGYLKRDAIDKLVRLEESGRNYGELLLRIIQMKLFWKGILGSKC